MSAEQSAVITIDTHLSMFLYDDIPQSSRPAPPRAPRPELRPSSKSSRSPARYAPLRYARIYTPWAEPPSSQQPFRPSLRRCLEPVSSYKYQLVASLCVRLSILRVRVADHGLRSICEGDKQQNHDRTRKICPVIPAQEQRTQLSCSRHQTRITRARKSTRCVTFVTCA